MDPFFWLLLIAGAIYAGRRSGLAAQQSRDTARKTRVTKKTRKQGGTPLTERATRRVERAATAGWWGGEALRGFPAHRAGLRAGWLAHRAAAHQADHDRAKAEADHTEAHARRLPERADYEKRRATAQAQIDAAAAADTGPRRGRWARIRAAVVPPRNRGRDQVPVPPPVPPPGTEGGTEGGTGTPVPPSGSAPSPAAPPLPADMVRAGRPAAARAAQAPGSDLRPGDTPCRVCEGDGCPVCNGRGWEYRPLPVNGQLPAVTAPAERPELPAVALRPGDLAANPGGACGDCDRPQDPWLVTAVRDTGHGIDLTQRHGCGATCTMPCSYDYPIPVSPATGARMTGAPSPAAPPTAPVESAAFAREWQDDTGDTWRAYRAPDGEEIAVMYRRAETGAQLPDPVAEALAVRGLNQRREARTAGEAVPPAPAQTPAPATAGAGHHDQSRDPAKSMIGVALCPRCLDPLQGASLQNSLWCDRCKDLIHKSEWIDPATLDPAPAQTPAPAPGAGPTTHTGGTTPVPTAENPYEAAIKLAEQAAHAADEDTARARRAVAETEAAANAAKARRGAAEQLADVMQQLKVDSASLDEQLRLIDQLQAAEKGQQEQLAGAQAAEKAHAAIADAAQVVVAGLKRRHGGIHAAVQDAPVRAAQSAFYQDGGSS